jgi:hypothetical protein
VPLEVFVRIEHRMTAKSILSRKLMPGGEEGAEPPLQFGIVPAGREGGKRQHVSFVANRVRSVRVVVVVHDMLSTAHQEYERREKLPHHTVPHHN